MQIQVERICIVVGSVRKQSDNEDHRKNILIKKWPVNRMENRRREVKYYYRADKPERGQMDTGNEVVKKLMDKRFLEEFFSE